MYDPIGHMNEGKRLHRERGTSGGRKTKAAKTAPKSAQFEWWLDREFAAIAAELAYRTEQDRQSLKFYLAENADPGLSDIPF